MKISLSIVKKKILMKLFVLQNSLILKGFAEFGQLITKKYPPIYGILTMGYLFTPFYDIILFKVDQYRSSS